MHYAITKRLLFVCLTHITLLSKKQKSDQSQAGAKKWTQISSIFNTWVPPPCVSFSSWLCRWRRPRDLRVESRGGGKRMLRPPADNRKKKRHRCSGQTFRFNRLKLLLFFLILRTGYTIYNLWPSLDTCVEFLYQIWGTWVSAIGSGQQAHLKGWLAQARWASQPFFLYTRNKTTFFFFKKKKKGQKFSTNRFVGNFIQLIYKIDMCPLACEKYMLF
jgi:hypothetical protein